MLTQKAKWECKAMAETPKGKLRIRGIGPLSSTKAQGSLQEAAGLGGERALNPDLTLPQWRGP